MLVGGGVSIDDPLGIIVFWVLSCDGFVDGERHFMLCYVVTARCVSRLDMLLLLSPVSK